MGRKAVLALAVTALILLNLGKYVVPFLGESDQVSGSVARPLPLHVNGQVAAWQLAHSLFDGHLQGQVLVAEASGAPRRQVVVSPISPPAAPVVVSPPAADPPMPAAIAPGPPDVVLVGTLFKGGVWAAFISRGQDTFLVRQGDMVGENFRVLSIDAKRVILKGISDGDVLEVK